MIKTIVIKLLIFDQFSHFFGQKTSFKIKSYESLKQAHYRRKLNGRAEKCFEDKHDPQNSTFLLKFAGTSHINQ